MWSRIRPRCAISLGESIAAAYSNSQLPPEYEFADNHLYWGPDGKLPIPSIKMFLSEARGLTPTNFWAHDYAGHTDEGTRDLEALIPGKVFNNPKPVKLIRRIIEHSCNSTNDIVLDFFAGSCVTAQAVIEANVEDGRSRRFIVVQLPEPADEGSNAYKAGYKTIAELGKERIRRAAKAIAEHGEDQLDLDGGNKLDPGFRAFRLDRSCFKLWNGDTENVKHLGEQLSLHVHHIAENSTASSNSASSGLCRTSAVQQDRMPWHFR